ncbi:MAG: dTMP kinase [Nitrososphaera sp.]
MARGKIIVLEGTDKAGKTTQSRMLQESLKIAGKVSVVLDFPDYLTPIGGEIRAFLDGKRDYQNQVKHLLFSANRWEKKEEIESMVENGTLVIMNRYWQSNLVYGVSNGLDEKWLLALDKGLPKEDIVLALLVSPTISSSRAETQDVFEKDPKLTALAHKNYMKYAKQFGWKVIDGSKGKEQVHQEILKTVKKNLKI